MNLTPVLLCWGWADLPPQGALSWPLAWCHSFDPLAVLDGEMSPSCQGQLWESSVQQSEGDGVAQSQRQLWNRICTGQLRAVPCVHGEAIVGWRWGWSHATLNGFEQQPQTPATLD